MPTSSWVSLMAQGESGFAGFYVATDTGAPIGGDFFPAGSGEKAEVGGGLRVIEEEDDSEGLVYGGSGMVMRSCFLLSNWIGWIRGEVWCV